VGNGYASGMIERQAETCGLKLEDPTNFSKHSSFEKARRAESNDVKIIVIVQAWTKLR